MASVQDYIRQADQLASQGKYEKAVQIYEKLIKALREKGKVDLQFFQLLNKAGDIYYNNLKNTELAIQNFRNAMDHYAEQGIFNNAIGMARKIQRIDPNNIEMYSFIGDYSRKQGMIGDAITNYVNYADKSLQREDKQTAIQAFKKILEMMPEKVDVKEKLVELYEQEGKSDFAIEYLKEIEAYYLKIQDNQMASNTRSRIVMIEKKLGREQKAAPEPPKPKPEPVQEEKISIHEDVDINIHELTEDFSKQLDDTFTFAQAEEPKPQPQPQQPPKQQFEQPPQDTGMFNDTSDLASSLNDMFDSAPQQAEESFDSLFQEDVGSYESFVELGKLQEDMSIHEAVQSYYQGADGYFTTNDYENSLRVYKRIAEIKDDEEKALNKIIEIAYITKKYAEAVEPYVKLAKSIIQKDPKTALDYLNNALTISPNHQEANALKNSLAPKHEAPKPQPAPQQPQPQPQRQEPPKQAPQQQPPVQQQKAFDPIAEFSNEILSDMESLDFLKEQDHLTANDIIKGKNEGDKPKFKVEDSQPQQSQDTGVWSLQELLDELKDGLDQNIAEEDVSSHYDLGVSFKEMGLYDMAIEEFQKSMKAKDYEMKSLEMLGSCFLEKGDLDLAESSLIKAKSMKGRNEVEYLGIKYTLGKLYEKKTMIDEALKMYNEIFTLDSKFEDVEKRIHAIKDYLAKNPAPQPQQKPVQQPAAQKAPQAPQPSAPQQPSQSDFIDFGAILKDEISDDINIDDIDIDDITFDNETEEEKEEQRKKNNKVSYM